MGYASISGKAVTNPDSPRAFAVCDRCGQWRNHSDLRWQFDYRGRTLANLRILVCETCEDDPQPQLKPRIIPPDPLPIANARVEQFFQDEIDDRTTTNPALPPVDFVTDTDIQLSGLQFIGANQLQEGELILVRFQKNAAQNGIYKASTGAWALQGYDNDRHVYVPAQSIDASWSGGTLYLQQLGVYLGAVYCARGANTGRLFQIDFDDLQGAVGVGKVSINYVLNQSAVNRYDLYTGIYMAGTDVRVTELSDLRVTQQVGQAMDNINEIPGFSDLVPGACDIGIPNEVSYGFGIHQGLPSAMDTLPFSGPLSPTLRNQSITAWLNNYAQRANWINFNNSQLSFKSDGFWPNPGPGAPARIMAFDADYHGWVNNLGQVDPWNNVLNQTVDWRNGGIYGIYPPGGNTLWTNEKCVITLWQNDSLQNVNFAELYRNAIPPNKPNP